MRADVTFMQLQIIEAGSSKWITMGGTKKNITGGMSGNKRSESWPFMGGRLGASGSRAWEGRALSCRYPEDLYVDQFSV